MRPLARVLLIITHASMAALASLVPFTAAARAASAPVRIAVQPDIVELDSGERQRFEARVLDARGEVLDMPVFWRSNGGRITGQGVFSADAAGRYTVTAETEGGRLVGTASAVVRAERSVLGRLVLRPERTVVAPGGTVQFRAVLLDRFGGSMGSDLVWTARGGRIDHFGLFTAGFHPGRFRVTVFERRSGASATAVVRVLGTSP